MTEINQARFTINATPSEDATTGDHGYDAINDEELTITLEVNPSPALGVTYFIYDPNDNTSPLASKDADELTWADSGTATQVMASKNGDATITMPSTGAHSYIIRAVATTPDGSDTYERMVVIRATSMVPNLRKTVPAEENQYEQRSWSDEQNDEIDAMDALVSGALSLDGAYNTFGANPAIIHVDNAEGQGDVTWDLTGAFSFNVDLENAEGTVDGFQVYDTVAEYWRLIRKDDAQIALESVIHGISYEMHGDVNYDMVGDVDYEINLTNASLGKKFIVKTDTGSTGYFSVLTESSEGLVGLSVYSELLNFDITTSGQISLSANSNSDFRVTTGLLVLEGDQNTLINPDNGDVQIGHYGSTSARLSVRGSSADGSTNIIVGQDSAAANVFTLNTNGDILIYKATNDASPEFRIGSADANEGHIQAVYDSGAQTLDYLLFSTDSATEGDIILSPAGNVGIGVTDPDTKVEIFHAGNQLKLSFDAADNATFGVDTSGYLTISPSGYRVGINAVPTDILDVVLNQNNTTRISVINSTDGSGALAGISFTSNPGIGYVDVFSASYSDTEIAGFFRLAASSGTNGFLFQTSGKPFTFYSTTPHLNFWNRTEEDTNGGRETKFDFWGEQSGGERTTLARLLIDHNGALDDEKGRIRLYVNDGSDGDSPTLVLTIDDTLMTTFAGNVLANQFSDGTATLTGGVLSGLSKLIGTDDDITSTSEGVAASLTTLCTNITTNGDSDEDIVTVADGTDEQYKAFAVVAAGNAADSVSIQPTNLIGYTKITFPADPTGLGCVMKFVTSAGGWVIIANNGGTLI